MISAEEFDRRFDDGEDMTPYLDVSKARRPGREIQRVNVDFPRDLLTAIDREAERMGVTRQAWIKLRLADVIRGMQQPPDVMEALRRSLAEQGQRLDEMIATNTAILEREKKLAG
jgi:hypothetical protein